MTDTTEHVNTAPHLAIAQAFVKLITGQDEPIIRIRAIDDNKARKLPSAEESGTIDQLWPAIEAAQANGYGVFLLPNLCGYSGTKDFVEDEDATEFLTLFCDHDGNTPSAWHRQPDVLVNTSPGRDHSYWLIDAIRDPEKWAHAQRRLIAHYKSDPAIKNPSRLMRLPGTLHLKGKPFLVTFESHIEDEDARMLGAVPSIDEVLAGLPDVSAAPEKAKASADVKIDSVHYIDRTIAHLRTCDIGVCGINGNNTAYATAAHVRDLGISEEKCVELMMAHWSPRCEPPWPEDELRAPVHNAYEYAQNEVGARAPKLSSEVFAHLNTRQMMYELRQKYPVTERPVIQLAEGDLTRIVDEAEGAIINSNTPLYQFGGALVKPAMAPYKIADGKEATNLRLHPVKEHGLIEIMTKAADFQRFDKRINDWVPKDCPDKIAKVYLARGSWNVNTLTAIIQVPALHLDGSVTDRPGYDPATGLLYEPGGVAFPRVPSQPTREDALAALKLFKDLLATFPFTTPASLSVALSAMLTPLIRRSLKSAPLHAFTAPAAGSGKSKLVDMASLIVTGKPAPVLAQDPREEENTKRLAAELMAGSQLMSFDNCTHAVAGDFLCQVLTQEVVKPRQLGHSKNIEIVSNSTLYATGNNLSVYGDMCRRTILSTIDAGVESPELRSFDFDPCDLILADRAKYVIAGLTILRAYIQNSTRPIATPLGSFEQWSRTVRDTLLWLGEADPCDTMDELRVENSEATDLRQLLVAWHRVVDSRPVTVKSLIAATMVQLEPEGQEGADGQGEGKGDGTGTAKVSAGDRTALLDALRQIGVTGSSVRLTVDTEAVGNYLRKSKGRIVSGYKLERDHGRTGGTVRWKVKRVA